MTGRFITNKEGRVENVILDAQSDKPSLPAPRTYLHYIGHNAGFAAAKGGSGTWVEVVAKGDYEQLERELAGMTEARDRTAALLNEAIEENARLRETATERKDT